MAVTCPYCGEPNTKMGLRGHITIHDDEDHGTLGRVPSDFDETDVGQEILEFENQRRSMFQTGDEEGREEAEEQDGLIDRLFGS